VQGQNAAMQIAAALKDADTKDYDIIVLARGGGSLEDLFSFNEEVVADTIFQAKTPIVSAIGHEIDWLISDFVADLRAPTPSAAMEMILPDSNELFLTLDSLSVQLTQQLQQKIATKQQHLEHLKNSFVQHSVERKMEQHKQELTSLGEQFEATMAFRLQNFYKELEQTQQRYPQVIDSILNFANNQLNGMKKMLESNHPKLKTKKGFAQISQNNRVVDIDQLEVGEIFQAQSQEIVLDAKVIKREKIV
jgi:exodeoxyribonuclease VII large subunit